jgi:hypothetical protein
LAVTVTVPPAGGVGGGTKNAACPLAVWTVAAYVANTWGEVAVAATYGVTWNSPQVAKLLQTDQSTPPLVVSLETPAMMPTGVGVSTVLSLTWSCDGAYGMKLVAITGMMVTTVDTERTGVAVLDAVDVAVIVMVPAGAVTGAVKAMGDPVAVWFGALELPDENVPQGVLVQATVQSTPALPMSLLTTAVKFAGVPAVTDAGASVNAMAIAGTTVMLALALFVLSVVEVAVTVTTPPAGTMAGATYVAVAPLAVCGVIEPHAPALAHVSVQSTPSEERSLSAVATKFNGPLTCVVAVAGVTLTTIGGGGTTVMTTVALIAGLVVDVALIVTVPPVGMTLGGVYTVATPLAVCVGLRLPQAPALAQTGVPQSTPLLAVSKATVAVRLAVVPMETFTVCG